jgi:uncharacterized protein YlxW (UPF0749 family)
VNALTKVFVILLVIGALLETAAVVVFVNKVDASQNALKQAKAQYETANEKYQTALGDAQAAKANIQKVQAESQSQLEAVRQQLNTAQQQVASKDAQLVKAEGQLQAMTLQNTQFAAAVNASEAAKGQLQTQTASLRKDVDQFLARNSDLNERVSDLQNKLDQTTREWRYTQEQLASAQSQAKRLNDIVKTSGLTPQETASIPQNAGAAINGVIRDTQNINGIEYATISVGSADGVSKGMEFNIINRQKGEWLGTLVVDKVDQNQAVGKLNLKGPVLGEIQANRTEVRTQL